MKLQRQAEMTCPFLVYPKIVTITGLDTVEESSESIISTMAAFGIQSNDTMSIIDKFNEVGNNFSITSAGIGDALQRSASALYASGNTIDESIALITAANQVVQNPEVVGTAFKTLSLRLRGAKTELQEAGEDVEGMAESTSQLQEKLMALTGGKVNIMADADTFKSTTQILREMAAVWDDMSDIDQAAALELMGGKRQANVLASLLNNFETVESAITTSMNSSGSAIAENEKWLDSIEGKTYQFTNALQTMWSNMLNSEVIKGFLDFGTEAIQLLDTGAGKVVALVAAFKLISKFKGFSIAGVAKGLGDTIQNITNAHQTLQALSKVSPVTGALSTESINAYAQAVAGLTAKQQANLLASQNLTKQDIQRVLQINKCTEAEQREALAHVHNGTTKHQEAAASQALFVAKTQAMAATYKNNAATLQGVAAEEALTAAKILETAASNNASKADLFEMINQSNLTAATKQQIVAELGLTAAKKAGEKATWGLKAAGDALKASNPYGWIMIAISAAITLITVLSNLEDRTQKIIDKAQEAGDAIKSINDGFKSDAQAVKDYAERFAELSQGVDMLTGKNLSLTTDDYAEFLDLSNQLADIFPTLTRNYDENGNAIIQLSGDTDTIVSSLYDLLDVQRQIANQQIAENLPDLYKGVKAKSNAYIYEIDDLKSQWSALNEHYNNIINSDFANSLNESLEVGILSVTGIDNEAILSKLESDYIKIMEDLGLSLEFLSNETDWNGNLSGFNYKIIDFFDGSMTDEEIAEAKSNISVAINELAKTYTGELGNLNNQIQTSINENKANWGSLSSAIAAWLSTDSTYMILNDNMQSMIQTIVNNLDYTSLDFKTWDDAQEWITDNIVKQLANAENKDAIQDALNNLLTVDEKTTSYKVYDGLRSALLTAIESLPAEAQDAIKKAFKLGGDSEYDTYLNHVKGMLQDNFDDMASELSLSDLKIANQLDVPVGTLLSWDELKQKISEVKNAAGGDIDFSKTYSVLAESVESYNGVLEQTAEIASNNTEVTQEYKDALADLGISQEDINECFDDSNPLVVKNAKALNQLVKAANKNVASNVKLAKSNARLDYYKLVKQLGDTLNSTEDLSAATMDAVHSTLEQIDVVEQAIYKYQLLEDTLLGVNNAFDNFAKAQEIDSLNTYGDSYVEMAQTMYDALYKTGQVGTESFWASVEALVPDSVYQGIMNDADRMKAIYDYYNKNILPSLQLKDDKLSLDDEAISEFVDKGLTSGVFEGDAKNFDLVEGMNLEKAAELMGMTEAQAYAMFAELDKYNVSGNEHSFLAQLDDSLEGRISNITNDIEDLNRQKLALLEDGGYEENKEAIDEINKKLAESNNELISLGQEAYKTWQEYSNIDYVLAALDSVEDKTAILTEAGAKKLGLEWDEVKGKTIQEAMDYLLAKQLELGQPTELTARLAIETIDSEIATLEEKIASIQADPTIVINPEQQIAQARQKIQELKNDKVEIATQFNIELSEEEKADLQSELNSIEQFIINDKEFSVVARNAKETTQLLEDIQDFVVNNKYFTINARYRETGVPRNHVLYDDFADGTAHVSGTAYKGGSWGAPRTETALVGELGPEMLVRNGKWTTIGENGAEFTQVKRGDIIFNHKQTEDLLSKGYVTGRGKAYASGTAYSGLWSPTSPDTPQSNKPGRDFSTNGNSLYNSAQALSDAADALSDSSEEFKEVFDWIEVRLEEINKDIDLKNAKIENAIGYSAQNKIIDELLDLNHDLYDNLLSGANEYYAFAEELLARVPEEYREAAQNGSMAIESFVNEADEETIEAINNYRDWVQKGEDATQQAEETLTEISNLAKQAIDNISQDFENKTSLNDSKISQLEAYNELLETDKGFESEEIYKAIIEANNSNIAKLQEQRDAMQAELNAQVEAGNIEKYSQNWYDSVNAIADVDTQIIELTTDTEDYQDAINELHWEHFDTLMSQYEMIADEAENLIDILGTKDVVDELGNWTDEGVTTLGLYAQQMEVAEMQAKKYEEEIAYLNNNWEKLGYTEEEYIEKLDELKDGQYDAIKAYHDSKDAIVDLNKERIDAIKEGIEKEIEAYEELINKKKEALSADKDVYDFNKSIMEQQQDLADIQRKLSALEGDNSAAAVAKKKQLKAEEAKLLADIEDAYYDRSVSNQQDALDKELENFQDEKDKEIEGWDEYLENTELVVSDSLATVQSNTDTVYQTLSALGQEYSLSITEALTSPWLDGMLAIQDYSDQFGLSISSTIEQLDGLSDKYEETIREIELAGQIAEKSVDSNFANYSSSEYIEPPKEEVKEEPKEEVKGITVGGKIDATGAKIYSYAGDTKGQTQYFKDDPIYTVLDEKDGYLLVRWHKRVSGETGWFKKSDVKAYASGSRGVSEDQWALIDELGDELQLVPDGNGRLAYIKKGTGILTSTMTERLMDLAMNPQMMIDANRPSVGLHPEIHSTEINLDINYGDMISIGEFHGDNLEDLEKMVAKQFEKHTRDLNNALKRFAR